MRQTPTFSMSRRMVQAIAQAAGRRGEPMSAIVREAVRLYISLDEDDRPVHPSSPVPGDVSLPPRDRKRE